MVLLICACESDEDKAGRFFLMGNNALNEGNFGEAVRLYTEAIGKSPKMVDAWNNRGVAYYKDKKYVLAINDYTHAIKQIDAYYMEAWRNRLDARYAAGLYGEAMADVDFLSDAYPDSAWVHFKAGLVLVGMKDYRRAVNAFRMSVNLDSGNVEALINYANAYYLYGTTRGGVYFNQAEDNLVLAEALDPSQPNIYNTRALMNIYTKTYDEALVQVNKAIALDRNNPYFNNNRGFIYLMTDELDKAEQDINLAIKGDPQNAWAYRNRGILFSMKDDPEAAARNFKQAALYDDSIPLLNYYWGAALLKLGNTTEGCEKLRISVDAFENEGRGLFEGNCGAI